MEVILITGGTGVIGEQLVKYFHKKNFQVVFTSTSKSKIENLYKKCKENIRPIGIQVNFLKSKPQKVILEKLKKNKIKINHLVNCARSLSTLKINKQGTTDRNNFLNEFLIDVVVPYELSIALFKSQPIHLKTITNISSQYGLVAANPSLYKNFLKDSAIQYGTSKAALHHLTKELAVRFSDKNIRVNCVAFGGIEGRERRV